MGGVGFLNAGRSSRALPISTPFLLSSTTKGTRGLAAGFALSKMGPTTPISYVPTFNGEASSFLDYEQRVILRNGSTEIPPEKRSTLLILHMGPAARQVCMSSGADILMEGCDVTLVAQVLRDYFQPNEVDRIFTQVENF